jgi:hypothetical protein
MGIERSRRRRSAAAFRQHGMLTSKPKAAVFDRTARAGVDRQHSRWGMSHRKETGMARREQKGTSLLLVLVVARA